MLLGAEPEDMVTERDCESSLDSDVCRVFGVSTVRRGCKEVLLGWCRSTRGRPCRFSEDSSSVFEEEELVRGS